MYNIYIYIYIRYISIFIAVWTFLYGMSLLSARLGVPVART